MKKISYGSQTIKKDDIDGVVKTLTSKFLTQGNKTIEFEKKISNYVNSKYSVSTNSGTSGLHMACLALGVSNKDIVWTVPLTWVASANCGLLCGAKIDFVDINEKNLNICVDSLNKKLINAKKNNKLPKVLVVVHFAGNPSNLNKIFKLSKKYNFKIIEDAAHALGSSYEKSKIGSCKFSDLTVFSFHPLKPITTGEGGVVTTNSKKIFEKLLLLRNHGLTKDKKKLSIKKYHNWYYEQKILGFNYRMNEIEATLGITQLKKLNLFNKKRNIIAKKYVKGFLDHNIDYQKVVVGNYSSYHLFVILFPNTKKIISNYDKIFREFHRENISVMLHYFPVHLHPYYKKRGFKLGDYPISENISKRAFSIPIFPSLSDKTQLNVIKSTLKILKNYS